MFGGFASSKIEESNGGSIYDANAFLFSITRQTKHNLYAGKEKFALYLDPNKKKFLCFGFNDITIFCDCNSEKRESFAHFGHDY